MDTTETHLDTHVHSDQQQTCPGPYSLVSLAYDSILSSSKLPTFGSSMTLAPTPIVIYHYTCHVLPMPLLWQLHPKDQDSIGNPAPATQPPHVQQQPQPQPQQQPSMPRMNGPDGTTTLWISTFLEIPPHGMALWNNASPTTPIPLWGPSSPSAIPIPTLRHETVVYSLARFRREEASLTSTSNNNHSNNHPTSRLYSLQGRVQALTPCLHLPPSSSSKSSSPKSSSSVFGLLQLVDSEPGPDKTWIRDYTCTVVLQRSYWEELHTLGYSPPRVGQAVVLHHVPRQEWRVPQVVAKQYTTAQDDCRPSVPLYVFVVQHVSQLVVASGPSSPSLLVPRRTPLDRGLSSSSSVAARTTTLDVDHPHTTTRATPNDMNEQENQEEQDTLDDQNEMETNACCSVEGIIQSVHWIQLDNAPTSSSTETAGFSGSGRYQLHYLELLAAPTTTTTNPDYSTHRSLLYLTYFPMDTSLQWSLRVGARIKAVNIHCFGSEHDNNNNNDHASGGGSTAGGGSPPVIVVHWLVACIRSSVYLMHPSPSASPPPNNKSLTFPCVQPLWYARSIPIGYREWNHRRRVQHWLCRQQIVDSSNCTTRVVDTMVRLLNSSPSCNNHHHPCSMQHSTTTDTIKNTPKRRLRNVYVEFFHPNQSAWDEANHDNGEQEDGEEDGPESRHPFPDACRLLNSWPPPPGNNHIPPSHWKLVSLRQIQDLCRQELQSRWMAFRTTLPTSTTRRSRHKHRHSTGGPVKMNWTATFVLDAQEEFLSRTEQESTRIWTGGRRTTSNAKTSHHLSSGTTVSVRGASFPVISIQPKNQSHASTETDLVMVQVQAIAVSLLCVVAPPSATSTTTTTTLWVPSSSDQENVRVRPWPITEATDRHHREKLGHGCFAMETNDGFYFIANAFLICNEMHFLGDDMNQGGVAAKNNAHVAVGDKEDENPVSPQKPTLSVGQVLEDTPSSMNVESQAYFSGLLMRKSIRPRNPRTFTGCLFTLAHFQADPSASPLSLLQTVEIKTSCSISMGALRATKQAASGSWARSDPANESRRPPWEDMTDEQWAMVHVWIQLASRPHSCALLMGGYDELLEPSLPFQKRLLVRMHVPCQARQMDTKERGYIRFQCDLSSLGVGLELGSSSKEENSLNHRITSHHEGKEKCPSPFEFIGGEDFVTGMLCTRPTRMGSFIPGPLCSGVHTLTKDGPGDDTGIPLVSIGDLMTRLCKTVGGVGGTSMAPSVVHEIRNASFLGVSYCSVMVECRKCFKPLTKRTRTTADVSSDDRPSYWDEPVPIPGMDSTTTPLYQQQRPPANTAGAWRFAERASRTLQCPQGHSVRIYGGVKWECSGLLDDGTGQAKLYAERDAALVLLLSSWLRQRDQQAGQFVDWIEEAALLKPETGVVFSRGIPPDSEIAIAVGRARRSSREVLEREISARRLEDNPLVGLDEERQAQLVLAHMDPWWRGEYLLQKICRTSARVALQPTLGYLVRCKPLSDEVLSGSSSFFSMPQTEVRLTVAAGGPRYPSSSCGNASTTTSRAPVGTAPCYRPNFSYNLPPLKLVLVDVAAPTSGVPSACR